MGWETESASEQGPERERAPDARDRGGDDRPEAPGRPVTARGLLGLQRSAGNAAVAGWARQGFAARGRVKDEEAEESGGEGAEAVEAGAVEVEAGGPVEPVTAASTAAQTLIDAMTAAAQDGERALGAAANQAISGVREAGGREAAALREAGRVQGEQVLGEARQAGADISEAASAGSGDVRRAQRDQQRRVAAWGAGARGQARRDVKARADRLREAGDEEAERARAAGGTAAERAGGALRGAAGEARSTTAGGGSSEAHAEVKTKVTGDAAQQMGQAAPQAQGRIKDQAVGAAAEIGRGGAQAADRLAGEAEPLAQQVAAAAGETGTQIAAFSDTAASQIRQQGEDAAGEVAAAGAERARAIRGQAAKEAAGVQRATTAAAAAMKQQAERATRKGRALLSGAIARLRGAQIRDDVAGELAGELGAEVSTAYGEATGLAGRAQGAVASELESTAGRAGGQVTQAAGQTGEALRAATERFRGGARQAGEAVAAAVAGAADATTQAGDRSLAEARGRLDGAAGTATAGLAQATGRLEESVTAGAEDTTGKAHRALAGTRGRLAEGERRVDAHLGGQAVQRSVADWLAQQFADLMNLLKSPSFWVGLVVTLVLLPAMGPAAFIVGGAVGGAVAGIEQNVAQGRDWYDLRNIGWNTLIGAGAGVAMALGVGFIGALGLGAGATTAGFMGLSAGVGIAVNRVNGDPWDRGLLANVGLAWLFTKLFRTGRPKDWRAPGSVETRTAPGRATERVPGLYESISIDPQGTPPGYQFRDTVSRSGSELLVRTEVTFTDPDVSVTRGHMVRGLDLDTGEFIFHEAFLDNIPKTARVVPSEPELIPGRGTPLEALMTMRQMKMLEERAGTSIFGGPRLVRMSTIVNSQTISQLAAAELAGRPLNEAVLDTHSVQYARNSITQGGGRITEARVVGGDRGIARDICERADLDKTGVPGDYRVLWAFDIELNVVPAGETAAPAAGRTGGRERGPVPVGTPRDEDR